MALRAYLELVRLPAVFTAPADVLAGSALALGAGASEQPLRLGALVLASAAMYCAGMAANDIFDLATDRRERPGRPLPSGRLSLQAAWTLVLTLQGVALGLAAWVGMTALVAVAGTIGATYLYDAVLKDHWSGPLAMGICRYGNALVGAALLPAGQWTAHVWGLPAGTAAYVVALTFLSRREVDGATRGQIAAPLAGLVALSALPALWPALGWLPELWAAGLVTLPLLWLAGPVRRAWDNPGAGPVRGAVMAGIFGIAMVNAALAAAAGGWWQAAVAVALLVPGRAVGRWFYAT
ncbi:MAG: UbiA family prenyltransferase [Myxococcales bacterium]|nr:UbiA family prenyltransferase [Myxococcales bacterium]